MSDSTSKQWSVQQNTIFDWFEKGKGNLVVRARAGTGKTTTILEGINRAPEAKVLLCAFNKKIAMELTTKLRNPRAEAKTLHSIGFKFVLRNWNGVTLNDDRAWNLAKRACQEVAGSAPDAMVKLVCQLASKGKGMCPFPQAGDLQDLAYQFDITPDEEWDEEGWTVARLDDCSRRAMDLAATERDGTIDFDDMVFLPVRNKWVRGFWDMVVVDECQDMSMTQIMLAQGACKKGGRIAVVGDDRQAIYAFRGADSGSLDRLKRELGASELGLTTTYRCPKKVVALAQALVPDFQAAPSAPEGLVFNRPYESLEQHALPGDFVLSRKNAPLAKACLALLRAGKRAKIEGKDMAKQLVNLVKKLKGKSMPDFLARLSKWEEKEIIRLKATGKKSAEARMEHVHDIADTLRHLSEGMAGLKELEARINDLFADMDGKAPAWIVCSSVHRAKGLETDRVFLLTETFANGHIEEDNIRYVAITRSKKELTWLTGSPS